MTDSKSVLFTPDSVLPLFAALSWYFNMVKKPVIANLQPWQFALAGLDLNGQTFNASVDHSAKVVRVTIRENKYRTDSKSKTVSFSFEQLEEIINANTNFAGE